MKNRTALRLTHTLFALALALAAESGELLAESIGKGSVRNIEVKIDEQNLDQFGVPLSATGLAQSVGKNLADAYFPVNKTGEKGYTHALRASIGRIERSNTPIGFSFSAGNSDPRAQDFQKADVLRVECRLGEKADPAKSVQESQEVSADALIDPIEKKQAAPIERYLVEQISTVCYGLLENLDLEESAVEEGGTPGKRPGWMPQIRIEIQNEEPAQPAPGKPGQEPPKANAAEEPKKKLIIHNQGSPVILKLGHERL